MLERPKRDVFDSASWSLDTMGARTRYRIGDLGSPPLENLPLVCAVGRGLVQVPTATKAALWPCNADRGFKIGPLKSAVQWITDRQKTQVWPPRRSTLPVLLPVVLLLLSTSRGLFPVHTTFASTLSFCLLSQTSPWRHDFSPAPRAYNSP